MITEERALELLRVELPFEIIKNEDYLGMKVLVSAGIEIDIQAEHDQYWVAGFEESLELLNEEDVTLLNRYGFFEDEDSWSHFA